MFEAVPLFAAELPEIVISEEEPVDAIRKLVKDVRGKKGPVFRLVKVMVEKLEFVMPPQVGAQGATVEDRQADRRPHAKLSAVRLDQPVQPRHRRRAAGQQNVIDRVVLPGGEEELQRARHLLHQRLAKRLQDLADVIIGQSALLFRQPGLLDGQAIAALDFLGQLLATEELFTGVDGAPVVQITQRRHGGADIHHSNHLFMRIIR